MLNNSCLNDDRNKKLITINWISYIEFDKRNNIINSNKI